MSLAWESVLLASLCEGGVTAFGRDGGIVKTGGVEPRPYARLPKAHASYVRGDVGIAPYGMTTDSRA